MILVNIPGLKVPRLWQMYSRRRIKERFIERDSAGEQIQICTVRRQFSGVRKRGDYHQESSDKGRENENLIEIMKEGEDRKY